MAFPDSILDDDEEVVRNMRPHWRRIAIPVVLVPIIVGLASFAITKERHHKPVVYAILVVAVVLLIWFSLRSVLSWFTTRYVVTNRRVLIRTGVLSRHGRDIP